MTRRLPIYFLIDVSESMVGEQIQLVEEGLATIIKELKADPYALETVHISIIVFAGQAMTLVPLTDIINFYPPKFPIGGGTSLGVGLGQLMYELRKNTIKTTAEQKGDWKPIIFLFTDGVPTDDIKAAFNEWKQNWQHQTNLVAVSFGEETDLNLLKELTENVLLFKNTTAQSYREFFRWVTASIKSSSLSVDSNGSGFELSKANDDIIEKIDLTKDKPKQFVDDNFVVISAKCQNTKRPYLIKFRKHLSNAEFGDLGLSTRQYRLVGAYQVGDSYFELSDSNAISQKISTEELRGAPTCPSCGNQFGFAACRCGGIHCIGNEQISTCPWCGNQGEYGFGEGGFDVNRTQG
ncbi:MAG: VWA domain-containing protein [Chitinophagaceae bacterium]|nr:VWA domain-containing protein [Chitinophagaceae bacterium]